MRKIMLGLLAVGLMSMAVPAKAQAFGPPSWVVEAWESGEMTPRENGPPAWVIEAWGNGEGPAGAGRPAGGPPRWIAERQGIARELGLPGPPAEVIEAWENGKGFDLPGPPKFVLDLLGF
jgi:hypothetical protein